MSPLFLSQGSIIDLDGTIFIQLGLFGLAYVLLRVLVFKPALQVFQAREAATQGTAQEANAFEELAEQHERTYQQGLSDAREEAQATRQAILSNAHAEESALVSETRAVADKAVRAREAEVSEALRAATAEIDKLVPAIVEEGTERLLKWEARRAA